MSETRRTQTQAAPPFGFRPGGGPPMAFLQDAPKSKDAHGTLRRLWGYLRQQRAMLLTVALIVSLTAVIDLLGPYLMAGLLSSKIV